MENKQAWIAKMWDDIAARRESDGDREGARQAQISADTFRTTSKPLASSRR